MLSKRFLWLEEKSVYEVVIVDSVSTHLISPLLPKDIGYLEVPVRNDTVFINFSILLTLFLCFPLLLKRKISLRGSYILSVARSTNAKLIGSIVDNNDWSNIYLFGNARVFSIQNGLRPEDEFTACGVQDVYFGFAQSKPKSLAAREYVGVGSLKLSLSQEHKTRAPKVQNSKVVFVSQYRPHAGNFEEMVRIQTTLAGWTSKFALARGLDFGLAMNGRDGIWLKNERLMFEAEGLSTASSSFFGNDQLGN